MKNIMLKVDVYLSLFLLLCVKAFIADLSWPVALVSLGILGYIAYKRYIEDKNSIKTTKNEDDLQLLKEKLNSMENRLTFLGLVKKK